MREFFVKYLKQIAIIMAVLFLGFLYIFGEGSKIELLKDSEETKISKLDNSNEKLYANNQNFSNDKIISTENNNNQSLLANNTLNNNKSVILPNENAVVDSKSSINSSGLKEQESDTKSNDSLETNKILFSDNSGTTKKESLLKEVKESAISKNNPESTSNSMNMNYDSSLIDLNSASIDLLMTLKGIGKVKATKIIDYRNLHGAFSCTEEIMNVPGIKQGTFSKIKDLITVR